MSTLPGQWKRQRRNVERLSRFVAGAREDEIRQRESLKRRSMEAFARFETMFLISATAVLWTSRLQDVDKAGDRRPVIELIHSGMIVRRWKRLSERVALSWQKN